MRWGTGTTALTGAITWISPENCGTVVLFMFPVGVAQIAWQAVLWCWAQHGIFIATHSAKAVPTSIEAIIRTNSNVILGLIYALTDSSIQPLSCQCNKKDLFSSNGKVFDGIGPFPSRPARSEPRKPLAKDQAGHPRWFRRAGCVCHHSEMDCPTCERLENELKLAQNEYMRVLALPLRVDPFDSSYHLRHAELQKLRQSIFQAAGARDQHVNRCRSQQT